MTINRKKGTYSVMWHPVLQTLQLIVNSLQNKLSVLS